MEDPVSENMESTAAAKAPARSPGELVAVVEALIFVSEEPIGAKLLADILGEEKGAIQAAVEQLGAEYAERSSGLQIREIAGGYQIATRPEFHEEIRAFLKTTPSAKPFLASQETLAVIAYKQPVTLP